MTITSRIFHDGRNLHVCVNVLDANGNQHVFSEKLQPTQWGGYWSFEQIADAQKRVMDRAEQ